MPAPRKPAGQRQDNRPERALAVVVDSGVDALVPSPRKDWRQATKDAWEAFWKSEVARTVTPEQRHVLDRLFKMRDTQQRAWDRYEAQPYVDGSKGQPVANPALDDALKLERAIQALEDRLGLSPKAKANLGIAFGQAQITAAQLNEQARKQAEVMSGADSDDGLADEWEAAN